MIKLNMCAIYNCLLCDSEFLICFGDLSLNRKDFENHYCEFCRTAIQKLIREQIIIKTHHKLAIRLGSLTDGKQELRKEVEDIRRHDTCKDQVKEKVIKSEGKTTSDHALIVRRSKDVVESVY